MCLCAAVQRPRSRHFQVRDEHIPVRKRFTHHLPGQGNAFMLHIFLPCFAHFGADFHPSRRFLTNNQKKSRLGSIRALKSVSCSPPPCPSTSITTVSFPHPHLCSPRVNRLSFPLPETPCVKFYHPDRTAGLLLRLCRKEECACAEGKQEEVSVQHQRCLLSFLSFSARFWPRHLDFSDHVDNFLPENCSIQKKEKISDDERTAMTCDTSLNAKTDFGKKVYR